MRNLSPDRWSASLSKRGAGGLAGRRNQPARSRTALPAARAQPHRGRADGIGLSSGLGYTSNGLETRSTQSPGALPAGIGRDLLGDYGSVRGAMLMLMVAGMGEG